jgi:hypothetical protein
MTTVLLLLNVMARKLICSAGRSGTKRTVYDLYSTKPAGRSQTEGLLAVPLVAPSELSQTSPRDTPLLLLLLLLLALSAGALPSLPRLGGD